MLGLPLLTNDISLLSGERSYEWSIEDRPPLANGDLQYFISSVSSSVIVSVISVLVIVSQNQSVRMRLIT